MQVFERGTPLSEWLTTERSAMAVFNMFYDVAKQLVRVHGAGVVHRVRFFEIKNAAEMCQRISDC